MSTMPLPAVPSPSRGARLLEVPLVRLLLGIIAVVLPVALTMALTQQLLDKSMRQLWPQLLAAALCVAAYVLYVHKVERRPATELSRIGAGRELGLGILLGAAVFLLAVGAIGAAGAFYVTGHAPWTVMIKPFAEMVLVAFFEEILFRALFFRIMENWLGSTIALALSALVFALTHLPNDNSTLLTFVITALAGIMFCAAYMVTRRLWLAVGIHFIWNFMGEAVFSLPVSGHPAKGMLQGQLTGPEWLSGGAYGIEGSAITLAVIGVAALWLMIIAARRGQFMAPARRRLVAP